MESKSFTFASLSVSAATAVLAGCATPTQGDAPARNALPQIAALAPQRDRDGSWMLPEARKVKELLYISDQTSEHVYVYNYRTRRLLGRLHGLYQPTGQCVDANGNVWIADYMAEAVVEYAHGAVSYAKRWRTLGRPNGCSIDPKSSSLAVSIYLTQRSKSTIEVFELSGRHRVFSDGGCQKIQQVGYDNHGNLYVAAASLFSSATVCELRHGSSRLIEVPVSQKISEATGVMWDGKYITFTDGNYRTDVSAIYQMQPTKSGGLEVVGTTVFRGNCDEYARLTQPFIVGTKNTPVNDHQGNAVVDGNPLCHVSSNFAFSYWSYPTGGSPTHTLFDSPNDPVGQSVSIGT